MRKHTIDNFILGGQGFIDRIAHLHRKDDSNAPNQSAQDFNESKGIVLIDDSRLEKQTVAAKGDEMRGLVTTSWLLNELINTNRGNYQHHHDNNKFFVNDRVSNHSTLHNQWTFGMLDYVWAMRENGWDALIINPVPDLGVKNTYSPVSERYKEFFDRVMAQVDEDIVNACGEVSKLKIKKWKVDDFDEISDEGDECSDPVYQYALKQYCQHIRWEFVEEDDDGNDSLMKDIPSFQDFINQKWKEHTVGGSHWLAKILERGVAQLNSFADPADTEENYGIVSFMNSWRNSWSADTSYKRIAMSEFKRSHHYDLDIGNSIRAEALKLRSQINGEETND